MRAKVQAMKEEVKELRVQLHLLNNHNPYYQFEVSLLLFFYTLEGQFSKQKLQEDTFTLLDRFRAEFSNGSSIGYYAQCFVPTRNHILDQMQKAKGILQDESKSKMTRGADGNIYSHRYHSFTSGYRIAKILNKCTKLFVRTTLRLTGASFFGAFFSKVFRPFGPYFLVGHQPTRRTFKWKRQDKILPFCRREGEQAVDLEEHALLPRFFLLFPFNSCIGISLLSFSVLCSV